MDGVDIHVDTDIGKQLSALATTLTSLTEVTDEDGAVDCSAPAFDAFDGSKSAVTDTTLTDVHEDRSRLTEAQMAAMVRRVNDLREAGVRRTVIEAELQKIRDLEKLMSSEVRKGWMKKLRRQSIRGPSVREPTKHVPTLSPVKASRSFTSPSSSPYNDWERRFVSP
jgi:hypothetical protein